MAGIEHDGLLRGILVRQPHLGKFFLEDDSLKKTVEVRGQTCQFPKGSKIFLVESHTGLHTANGDAVMTVTGFGFLADVFHYPDQDHVG